MSGEVRRIADEWWRGNLVHDAVIRGLNCAAGEVDLYFSERLRWCLLSSAQKIPAGDLPRGTAVLLDSEEPSGALLHLPPKVGMHANPEDVWNRTGRMVLC